MAVGDPQNMLTRLKSLLPARWFSQSAPILDAVLGGLSDSLNWCHNLFLYVKAQTRIDTATEFNLDLIAWDFLGRRLRRKKDQPDDSFRFWIKREIFRPRANRPGMSQALEDLTGVKPIIFEPWNPNDTGVWGRNMGWSAIGRYGSLAHPYECWIDVQRPKGQGIPGVNGYGGAAGGYGNKITDKTGREEWVSLSMVTGPVTDRDIYDAIEATRPAVMTCWTRISDIIPPDALSPSYDFLLSPQGDRLVLDDESGIILDGPPYEPPEDTVAQPDRIVGHPWFNDKTQSGQIMVIWPF